MGYGQGFGIVVLVSAKDLIAIVKLDLPLMIPCFQVFQAIFQAFQVM